MLQEVFWREERNLLTVLCGAFPLRSGERGWRAAQQCGGEWRQAVLSVQASPLGAVWELAWSWDGCHRLHPGCLRVQETSGSVPGSRSMGRGGGDGEQEESCVVF